MSEFTTYEHVVKGKKCGRTLIKKLLMILFYLIFTFSVLAFAMRHALLPLMVILPVLTGVLIFLSWRYVNVEYEYSISSGEVTFSKIYGGRSRRKVLEFSLRDCVLIAPTEACAEKAEQFAPSRVYYAVSAADVPDSYTALFDSDGFRGAFVFEATEKALKICRFYNAPATVLSHLWTFP